MKAEADALRFFIHGVFTFSLGRGLLSVHHGDTEDTEGARRISISNLKSEISDFESLRASSESSVPPW